MYNKEQDKNYISDFDIEARKFLHAKRTDEDAGGA